MLVAALSIQPVLALSVSPSLPDSWSRSRRFGQVEVRPIAIFGHDKRKLLSDSGLSKDEQKRIRETTGYIYCPASGPTNRAFASAALVGDGSHIITAAHALIDRATGKRREPLSSCYFRTQASSPQKAFLNVLSEGGKPGLLVGSKFPDDSGDFAVARLKTKIGGVNPFSVDLSMQAPSLGIKTLVISGNMKGFDNHHYQEPIFQECPIENFELKQTLIFFSSCDFKPGASGSIHLIRRTDGQLVIKAVAVSGAIQDSDRYDYASGQVSKSIGVDGEFLADILFADPSIKPGQGAVQ